MILGVISDTHTDSVEKLPKKAIELLSGVDMVIHAGDYTQRQLVQDLEKLSRFTGVHGNMDSYELKSSLPSKLTLELGGFKIGVTHPPEGGAPFGIEGRVRKKFAAVDMIIYGHTHMPKTYMAEGVLFLNPGSATGIWPATKRTMAMVRVEDKLSAEIVRL